MGAIRRLVVSTLIAIALAMPVPAIAQPSETAVKAAFLPRFARYVTWPQSAAPSGNEPFVLCVIGTDPFGSALDQAAQNQSIDGRRIVVRRLSSARLPQRKSGSRLSEPTSMRRPSFSTSRGGWKRSHSRC